MKLIFIDPGHSSIDPGAVGFETEFRLAEAVSKYQAEHLRGNYVCEVFVCPSNVDSLAEICDMANGMGAGLYVSNHFNAGGGDGFECYVHNQNRVGLGQLFAKYVAEAGQNLRSGTVPGVKINPGLYVLKHTNMPAILTEGAFVDNRKDIGDWNEDHELQKLGAAYGEAAAEYLHLAKRQNLYSLEQFVRDVQAATGSAVDGIAGAQTISNTPTVSAQINREHPVVAAIQKRLYALGYTMVGAADGIAGAKFTAAVTQFQADNRCRIDGEITAKNKTWRLLLGMQ